MARETPRGTADGTGTVIVGHRLLRLLGSGVQSQVFAARRLSDGAEVAFKLAALATPASGSGVDPAAVAADFLRAAQVARQLHHPHIVSVHEVGVEAGAAWLSMELVSGGDLQRHTRVPQLPAAQVLHIGHGLAAALSHAHRQGVVHRDLKPANVLLDGNDNHHAKLADFGLARALGGSGHTGTGIVPGTPAYMAPELLAGAAPDAATDLYALGVLLFELLAGRPPHEATRMGELLHRVAHVAAPDLRSLRPTLPAALAVLLARLLAKNPRQRPESGDAVAAELLSLQAGLPAA